MLYSVQKVDVKQTKRPDEAKSSAFVPELLRSTGDLSKYQQLVENETSIDWLGYCAKLYKKSHAINSVATRIKGTWVFREFLKRKNLTLADAYKQVKKAKHGAKYRLFDEFSTWCDGIKGYAPNVTWSHVMSAKSVADFCDCGISDDDFAKHVTMPTATSLDNEEYPPNEKIQAIVNVSSPLLRGFVLTMCDAGLEPVDAAKLQKNMIYFDEKPVRLEFRRKKTSKPVTAFISDTTAQLLKRLCTDKSDSDFVFTDSFTPYRVANMRQMYNRSIKRAGLAGEKVKVIDAATGEAKDHKFGKYHMKIYKKRFFTLAIAAGVPEFVVQGMLGRKKYLDQYMALPLDKKREFASRVLAQVSIYAEPQNKQVVRAQVAEVLGLENVDDKTLSTLKGLLQGFSKLPADKLDVMSKILAEAAKQ